MAKFLLCVLLVFGPLLDQGICTVNVTCRSLGAYVWSYGYCYFVDFPVSDFNKSETFKYHEEYDITASNGTKRLEFIASKSASPITVKHIPNGIFAAFPHVRVYVMATNLEELDPSDFIHAMNLKELNLSHNKLKIIKNSVFSAIARRAQSMSHPTDVTDIKLDPDIECPLRMLDVLKLDHNEIAEIEDYSFYGLNNLTHLGLLGNHMKCIHRNTLTGLPALRYLYLNKNGIETIEDGALNLPELELLHLQENKMKILTDVVFDRLPNLEVIALDQNGLEHIGRSLYALLRTKNVTLDDNRIQDIDLASFARMPRLRILTLKKSGFTFARAPIEYGQRWDSNVFMLNLMDNNLTDPTQLIKLRIFPNLMWLDLDGNSYKNLSIGNLRASEPNVQHQNIKNLLLTFSSIVAVPIADLTSQFKSLLGVLDVNTEYRTLKDIMPKLRELSLHRVEIDCVNMTSIVQEYQSKEVTVKHDCNNSTQSPK